MDATETLLTTSDARMRWRRWGWGVALAGLGIALGLGAAVGPRLFDDASASGEMHLPAGAVPLASLSTRQVADATSAAGAAIAAANTAPDAPAPPASTARDAVEAFLTAEVAGSYDRSYGYLSAADRGRVGGRAPWIANHANLPPVTGFVIDGVTTTPDGATVTTSTDLRSSLDEVAGLVPAHARGAWVASPEDGGWRVSYGRSRLTPQYPAASLASDVAREWVVAAQACRHAAEWEGGVVGAATVERRLCHRPGPVSVAPATTLTDDPGSELPAAFGPEVFTWARRVSVTGPARLELILAPVGERWLVIGSRETSPDAR